MSEGKIAYWEALGFKSFREGDFSQAHTYWQNAEHLKRKHEDGDMEVKQHKGKSKDHLQARGVRVLRKSRDNVEG